jgi:hypothetical protein
LITEIKEGNYDVNLTLEFPGGCIPVKVSVKNTSDLSILDAALELKSNENISASNRGAMGICLLQPGFSGRQLDQQRRKLRPGES